MKAKLLKEQMGVPAGTELDVVEVGRSWTLRAPSGAGIVVSAFDVEMVPEPVEFEEPVDPDTDPAVRDEDGNVVMNGPERTLLDDERDVDAFPAAPSDDDLDEPLPEQQDPCEGGDSCESCT